MRISLYLVMISSMVVTFTIVYSQSLPYPKEWEIYILSEDSTRFLSLNSSSSLSVLHQLNDSESTEVLLITSDNLSYLSNQYFNSNLSAGIFSIGALWYWNHPDPTTFFYYKETLSGVFEVSFSIVMEDITPPSLSSSTAPLAPSAPI